MPETDRDPLTNGDVFRRESRSERTRQHLGGRGMRTGAEAMETRPFASMRISPSPPTRALTVHRWGRHQMTAEIAILNKTAIALAADSKVTLSTGGKQKTYDTVDKLFSLSKTEPVGAMIYGNAEFVGFPWETIIKEY